MLALVVPILALNVVAQAPAASKGPIRVLVLETRADAAYVDKVRAFGDLLATILEDRAAAEIVPSSSIKDRLAVAADKAQAGCDDTACMTELAGALDARFVVTSRASQVGGRWLMRVELFDGQDLKVVAQSTAMSDSVEGLASQAEVVADGLLAKSPMIPRKDGSNVQGDPALAVQDAGGAGGGAGGAAGTAGAGSASAGLSTPLIVGGVSSAAALATATVGTLGFLYARGKEVQAEEAQQAYIDDPTPDTRRAFASAAVDADDTSTLHNCVLLPIGCLCIPLGAVGVGGLWWGLSDDSEP